MAATLFGLNSGVATTIDMSSKTIDVSLVDITEGVLGSNVLIGLTNLQFGELLEISAGAVDGSGLVSFNETALRDILADVIDNEVTGTYTKLGGSSVNGTDVSNVVKYDSVEGGSGFSDYASTFVSLNDMISTIRSEFKSNSKQILKDKVAAKASGLSLTAFKASGISANLVAALGTAGVFADLDSAYTDTSFLGEAGLTANSLKDNDDFISVSDAAVGDKMALFNSLADSNYLAEDDLENTVGLSFDTDFAIGMMLTLKGGIFSKIKFSDDISFVNEEGEVIPSSTADNLVGQLVGESFSTGITVEDFSSGVSSDPTAVPANTAVGTSGFVENPSQARLTIPVLFVVTS